MVIRGLNKRKLINTILYHRRVVQTQIKDLSSLRKSELAKIAKKEGLKINGGEKARISQNIAMNRLSSRIGSMKCKNLRKFYQNDEIFKLISRKGVSVRVFG